MSLTPNDTDDAVLSLLLPQFAYRLTLSAVYMSCRRVIINEISLICGMRWMSVIVSMFVLFGIYWQLRLAVRCLYRFVVVVKFNKPLLECFRCVFALHFNRNN